MLSFIQIELAYQDYLKRCKRQGEAPMIFKEWLLNQMVINENKR